MAAKSALANFCSISSMVARKEDKIKRRLTGSIVMFGVSFRKHHSTLSNLDCSRTIARGERGFGDENDAGTTDLLGRIGAERSGSALIAARCARANARGNGSSEH